MHDMTHDERVRLTRAIIAILDQWGVSPGDQVSLLGLPEGTPSRTVRRYRDDTPLPDEPAVMERVEHIIGIAEALRTTYPHNASMGAIWMQRPHRRFGRRSPVAAIIEDGLSGLQAVRADLDCGYAWRQTDVQA